MQSALTWLGFAHRFDGRSLRLRSRVRDTLGDGDGDDTAASQPN
jgi:hypothetical protein